MSTDLADSHQPDAGEQVFAHGYTQADIDGIARRAAHTARATGGNPDDRYNAAWSAIAEALTISPHRPDPRELTTAAWKAVNQSVSDARRHHGRDDTGRTRRSFARYWEGAGWRPAGPEDAADHVALGGIWPRLTPTDRRALAARAEHPTAKAAAAALGIPYHTYASQLSRARRRFRALWQDDAPERPPMTDHAPRVPAKYDALNRTLAERMVRLRRARGWSAERLASALTRAGRPTRRSTLANVESLHSKIPADLMVALAEVFDIPLPALAALKCGICRGAPPKGFACTTCGAIAGSADPPCDAKTDKETPTHG